MYFEEGCGQERGGVAQWFSSRLAILRNTFYIVIQIPGNLTMKMQVYVYNVTEINPIEKHSPLLFQ